MYTKNSQRYAHWNADKLLVPRHYSALPPPLSCFASLPSSQAFPAIHQQLRGGGKQKCAPKNRTPLE